MFFGWTYRGVAAVGVVALSVLTASVALFAVGPEPLAITNGQSAVVSVVLVGAIMGAALTPLYSPRPRPVLTVLRQTGVQVGIGCLSLLSLGALGIGAVPSPATVVAIGAGLALVLPVWFWACRRRREPQRVVVVGDDPSLLESTIRALPVPALGFLSPALVTEDEEVVLSGPSEVREPPVVDEGERTVATDGGMVESLAGVDRLSGLSRLEHVLRERDVDTVALAFRQGDREECFGVLRVCHEYGVDVLAHESLSEKLLAGPSVGDELVTVDLEPWPWYSRLAKRAFDLAFATVGLLVLAPLIIVISVAIKLDSPGPVLYGQRRTAELGATFPVWKFRSMLPESEDARPGDADDRITRVGRVLRKTHMDEIPQLITILVGDMSVVGPRAAWTDEEKVLMAEVDGWSRRWTITPGLTGLAQIRGIDSTDGQGKLECDLEYIQCRSLLFDLRIVLTQIWFVLRDVGQLIAPR
ncbi:sugar transferase [Natronorubrum thiooxidans]|uniref:Sugar transferase involved in LPS biosynthesis (Colanic, teichoic acid) n=1 Tax=Natronorubrum thiooxidans TaxID=308853 RepID=A0A1N7GCW0_9EURY|nr:sugar transferase [Natronorubrum thiooxidans]SIS10352.1 Sugar transferase involved in LPS biosynthesis (colanic, teichoic acid) [Natronorubrum thiooxidans]